MSVKVAVRVRPFNQRELDLNSKLIVKMENNTTYLTDSETGKVRDFTFDYSFWSHDGFSIDNEGIFQKESSNYADQTFVYNAVGEEILQNAWEGYHCCLFAYGQTGSGKSYSMVGYGPNQGIVPQICQQIFKRILSNDKSNKQFEVQISMLEIYNEKISDLLIPVKDRAPYGLKIREHKSMGVYVEDLTKHAVDSYEAIEELVEQGNRNRTIACTLMNNHSSRAHTIISIDFKQREYVDGNIELQRQGRGTEKFSVINLVDLAGSEKIGKTGASGDRLKEGCSINKSLSFLGLVISKLAELATSKNKNIVVPYRESSLTRILQNALGGNSKTLMICALSPADDNYEETLSTLRYADQAKRIKCNAVINETEQDKMIRELRIENDRLKLLMENQQFYGQNQIDNSKDQEKLKEMEEQLRQNAGLIKLFEMSFQQKLVESKNKATSEQVAINESVPHLMNLNEDPMLNGKITYPLTQETTFIGRKNGVPTPQIILASVTIKQNHAIIRKVADGYQIEPFDESCRNFVHVNGKTIIGQSQKLQHLDRIVFGNISVFLMKIPNQKQNQLEVSEVTSDLSQSQGDYMRKRKSTAIRKFSLKDTQQSPSRKQILFEHDIDYEFAQNELIDQEQIISQVIEHHKRKSVDIRNKLKFLEQEYQRQQQETLVMKHGFEQQIVDLEQKVQSNNNVQEKQKAKKCLQNVIDRIETEKNLNRTEKEKLQIWISMQDDITEYKIELLKYLQEKLQKYLPKVMEVNLIAKELQRKVKMSIQLPYFYIDSHEVQSGRELMNRRKKKKVEVLVNNSETQQQYMWSLQKFQDRYYAIKQILDQKFENALPDFIQNEDDPFWDHPEKMLQAQGYLILQPLSYKIQSQAKLTLVNQQGEVGYLDVNKLQISNLIDIKVCIEPIREDGIPLTDNEYTDDPKSLLGFPYYIQINIKNLHLQNKCLKPIVEYQLQLEEKVTSTYQTDELIENDQKQQFDINYQKNHCFSKVTQSILNDFQYGKVAFKIFGYNEPKHEQDEVILKTQNSQSRLETNGSRINTEDDEMSRSMTLDQVQQIKEIFGQNQLVSQQNQILKSENIQIMQDYTGFRRESLLNEQKIQTEKLMTKVQSQQNIQPVQQKLQQNDMAPVKAILTAEQLQLIKKFKKREEQKGEMSRKTKDGKDCNIF